MLTCVAFGLGAVSLASIALAISTDYWLLLYEEVDSKKLVHIDEELSENMTLAKIPKFFPVHSKIGLWRFCVIKEMIGEYTITLRGFNFNFFSVFVYSLYKLIWMTWENNSIYELLGLIEKLLFCFSFFLKRFGEGVGFPFDLTYVTFSTNCA